MRRQWTAFTGIIKTIGGKRLLRRAGETRRISNIAAHQSVLPQAGSARAVGKHHDKGRASATQYTKAVSHPRWCYTQERR